MHACIRYAYLDLIRIYTPNKMTLGLLEALYEGVELSNEYLADVLPAAALPTATAAATTTSARRLGIGRLRENYIENLQYSMGPKYLYKSKTKQ